MSGTSTTTRDTEIARNPIRPKGGGGTASILCRSSSTMHSDIVSLSLRELAAVALATNVIVFMERGTILRLWSKGLCGLDLDLPEHPASLNYA